MEACRDFLDIDHPDIRWQTRVETSRHGVEGMRGYHLHAGDLAECVNPGISPARALHRDRRLVEACERLFQ